MGKPLPARGLPPAAAATASIRWPVPSFATRPPRFARTPSGCRHWSLPRPHSLRPRKRGGRLVPARSRWALAVSEANLGPG